MDDIDDILNEVSRNARDPFADFDEAYASAAGGRLHSGQAALQALTRAWVNERGAAELLSYVSHLPPLVNSLTHYNVA